MSTRHSPTRSQSGRSSFVSTDILIAGSADGWCPEWWTAVLRVGGQLKGITSLPTGPAHITDIGTLNGAVLGTFGGGQHAHRRARVGQFSDKFCWCPRLRCGRYLPASL